MAEGEHFDGRRKVDVVSRPVHDGIVVAVRGEIDLATVDVVEQELRRAEESHDRVVLDLSRTSFMDSTGVYLIIAVNSRLQKRGASLVVAPGPPQIRRLFELTGLADHVELISDTTELGVAAAHG